MNETEKFLEMKELSKNLMSEFNTALKRNGTSFEELREKTRRRWLNEK